MKRRNKTKTFIILAIVLRIRGPACCHFLYFIQKLHYPLTRMTAAGWRLPLAAAWHAPIFHDAYVRDKRLFVDLQSGARFANLASHYSTVIVQKQLFPYPLQNHWRWGVSSHQRMESTAVMRSIYSRYVIALFKRSFAFLSAGTF